MGFSGQVRVSLLVEESAADDVLAQRLRLVRLPRSIFDSLRRLGRTRREKSAERTGWRAFRRSRAYSCPGVAVTSADPVDQFRVISFARKRQQYRLAILEFDGGTNFPRRERRAILKPPSQAYDVHPGATLAANPFANAGDYAVLFIPWTGKKGDRPRSSLREIEGWRIVDTVGV